MVVGGAGIRARESQAPVQLLLADDAGTISTATGFIFECGGREFLITNWHNVSGKHFLSGELLKGRPPVFLKARLATNIGGEGTFTTVPHRVELYDPDSGAPLWYEHPHLGNRCDVVALPFERPSSTPANLHVPVNRINAIAIPVRPGSTVFILGFPRNLSVHIGWPLWKSGYIASEPHYDVRVGGKLQEVGGHSGGTILPAFFIDGQTRSGMSGAPVFANYTGSWDMTDPYRPVDPTQPGFHERDDIALGENRLEFVGAYSSRVPAEEGEAALGLCFNASRSEP
jgi:hypothetical protein